MQNVWTAVLVLILLAVADSLDQLFFSFNNKINHGNFSANVIPSPKKNLKHKNKKHKVSFNS